MECNNCGEPLRKLPGEWFVHNKTGLYACPKTYATYTEPGPERVPTPKEEALLDEVMDNFFRKRAPDEDQKKHFRRLFNIYCDIDVNLVKDLISAHRDVLEQRSTYDPPKKDFSNWLKCRYCNQPILGGKGDWWHANAYGSYGDMRCFDQDQLACPKTGEGLLG